MQTAVATNEENPVNKIKEYIIDEEAEQSSTYSQMVIQIVYKLVFLLINNKFPIDSGYSRSS